MDEEFLNPDEEDFETDDYEEVSEDAEAEVKDDSDEEEEAPPPVPPDHVVHVYEFGKFMRTIEREFTAEDAEEFASDYNRTAKTCGRFALAAKAKSRPKKTVPWPNASDASK